jgi:hypothetical protein
LRRHPTLAQFAGRLYWKMEIGKGKIGNRQSTMKRILRFAQDDKLVGWPLPYRRFFQIT